MVQLCGGGSLFAACASRTALGDIWKNVLINEAWCRVLFTISYLVTEHHPPVNSNSTIYRWFRFSHSPRGHRGHTSSIKFTRADMLIQGQQTLQGLAQKGGSGLADGTGKSLDPISVDRDPPGLCWELWPPARDEVEFLDAPLSGNNWPRGTGQEEWPLPEQQSQPQPHLKGGQVAGDEVRNLQSTAKAPLSKIPTPQMLTQGPARSSFRGERSLG